MRLLFVLLSIILAVGFIGCGGDDCPGKYNYNFGEILLEDSAKQFILPYLKNKKVFFKDSLSNEIEYDIESIYKKTSGKISKQYSNNCPSYANYSYISDGYYINFIGNNKLQGISLVLSPFFSENTYETIQSSQVAINNTLNYFSIFFEKKLQLNTNKNPEITLTANGKTYKNVIVPNAKTYFHRQYGLLAFRDSSRTLWVFDRFE